MNKQQNDQKAVVLGAAIFIALFIGGVFLVSILTKDDQKAATSSQTPDTTEQASGTTQTPTTTPPSATTPTTTPTKPASTPAVEPPVEKELTIPPTVDQIKTFFVEGITNVRYWYEDMDTNDGYEVVVAYAKDKQAHLAVLTGIEPLYHILWDAEIPGQSVTSLDVGDRNDDDKTEMAVFTAQSAGSGYMNLLQFSDTAPVVFLLKGGELDGSNSKISFTTTVETLNTSAVWRIDLGDKNGNGKDEINILTGPAVGDTAGEFQVYQDMYEWDGSQYTFIAQSLVSGAAAEE